MVSVLQCNVSEDETIVDWSLTEQLASDLCGSTASSTYPTSDALTYLLP